MHHRESLELLRIEGDRRGRLPNKEDGVICRCSTRHTPRRSQGKEQRSMSSRGTSARSSVLFAAFIFAAQAFAQPAITEVVPNAGALDGGEIVQVLGTNFPVDVTGNVETGNVFRVGRVDTNTGGQVSVPIYLFRAADAVASPAVILVSIEFDDAVLSFTGAVASPELILWYGKEIAAGATGTTLRVIVFNIGAQEITTVDDQRLDGNPTDQLQPFPLGLLNFDVLGTTGQSSALTVTNATMSAANADEISDAAGQDGLVCIGDCLPLPPRVTFGANDAVLATQPLSNRITVFAPAASGPGPVDVKVIEGDDPGNVTTAASAYTYEGVVEGMGEGMGEGVGEGIGEGAGEGIGEGAGEGIGEGAGEGIGEGVGEGIGEGVGEGVGEGIGEGAADCPLNDVAITFPANGATILVPDTLSSVSIVAASETSCPADTLQVDYTLDDVSIASATDRPYGVTLPSTVFAPTRQFSLVAAATSVNGVKAVVETTSIFNVTQIAAASDADANGLPDNPFATLTMDGEVWLDVIDGRRFTAAIRWTGMTGDTDTIQVGLADPAQPNRRVIATAPRSVLGDGEVGYLIVTVAPTLDALVGAEAASDFAALPSGTAIGAGQFVSATVIYSTDGGVTFSEAGATRLAANPIEIFLEGVLTNSRTTIFGHPAVITNPGAGIVLVPDMGEWSITQIASVVQTDTGATVLLTQPSVFGPLEITLKGPAFCGISQSTGRSTLMGDAVLVAFLILLLVLRRNRTRPDA